MQLKLTLEKSYKNIFNFLKFNMLYIAIIKRNIILLGTKILRKNK